ncbi:hypothetical protein H072_4087 [Dactylellina haptotyla CBS 200.50]|uniref:RING-type domain-containing protein n=1 Tax=Dactylellina haptotyla (strain CBS 200.50) TaxID=1284197 RepID=S8AGF0_DACHA|nr:hypothetical protein H072_4087 [Dactylellina haptotyla CBS 200.50]
MASYYYHIVLELHHRSEPVSQRAIDKKLAPETRGYKIPSRDADIFAFDPSKSASCASHNIRGDAHVFPTRTAPPPDYLDYRFSTVSLENIDMQPQPQASVGSDLLASRLRGKSVSFAEPADSHSSAIKAKYIPIVSPSTDIGYGVVHLYRDKAETPGLFKSEPSNRTEAQSEALSNSNKPYSTDNIVDTRKEKESTVVAILAVPAYMTPSDFLGFVGDDAREAVSHFRLIRTGDDVRKYMALMKFRKPEDARVFVRDYNGRAFNTMEPETCQVVFVKSVQFQVLDLDLSKSRSLNISNHPSCTSIEESGFAGQLLYRTQLDPESPKSYQQNSVTLPVASTHLTTKPAPPPTASLLELPTCPVCLERMDETTGLLTTQCQHVFHCACLSKWKDGSCPVCRYTSSDKSKPPGTRHSRRKLKGLNIEDDDSCNEDEFDMCFSCGAVDNLWVCLICGHIGCGRYDEKHAYEHYEQTQHCFAIDIETQRVWDYASDQYVHRLVQNKSDGKLLELPSVRHDSNTEELYDKLDNIGMEYTYLLTSQLDSQRIYFEEQVITAADKATKACRRADEAAEKLQRALYELEELKSKVNEFSLDVVPSLEKSKNRAEKKAEKATELLRKFEKDWREEKTVNDGLLDRVDQISKEREELLQENVDLKDQLRDLMFFVEGREKLKDIDEEGIEEGEVSIGDAPDSKKKRKGKGKGKR